MLPSIFLAESDHDRQEILRSYVETYINEEIQLEAQLRNIGTFLRFLAFAASENGELINFSNIAREAGVKSTTAKNYYQILEDTLLGFFLFPFSRSIRKKMGKHPKFYFLDPGVVTALTKKLTLKMEYPTKDYGEKFEHFLICEIKKWNEYKRRDCTLSFYRTERGAEVNCIIEIPDGTVVAVEIKATASPSSSHCRGLRSFKECVPQAQLLLACQVPKPIRIGDTLALPWQEFIEHMYLDFIS